MEKSKQYRILEIFLRLFRGEDISVKQMAEEYGVSAKSITRDINDIKAFLLNRRDAAGNAELTYCHRDKCYRLVMEDFLTDRELFALVEVIIGSRAFSKKELDAITGKLKGFTTPADRKRLNDIIANEMYHYPAVKHDCESVEDNLWQIINCIGNRREITIEYYKMDRSLVTHRIKPASVMFNDYYFYMIAFKTSNLNTPVYFRVDRIKSITEHRVRAEAKKASFDEGLLRRRSLFMWPGKLQTVRFEFSGPSLQAVLDKLPTARVVERLESNRYLIEAETYGDGIKMWLLSQGSWVKAVAPEAFRQEMIAEIEKIKKLYN